MKILIFSFMLMTLFATNAVFAPVSVVRQQFEAEDWSALFPEIAGCRRVVEPLSRNGAVVGQTADYRSTGSDEPYSCGAIALSFEPGARKAARARFAKNAEPTVSESRLKNFDAYRSSPLCGNDDSLGSIRVYFDEDKAIVVSARKGSENLMSFAENADYELLKKTIERFVRSGPRNEVR